MQKPREALDSVTTAFLQLKGYSYEAAVEKVRAIREEVQKTSKQIALEREQKLHYHV